MISTYILRQPLVTRASKINTSSDRRHSQQSVNNNNQSTTVNNHTMFADLLVAALNRKPLKIDN
jgi:hypothetical protein